MHEILRELCKEMEARLAHLEADVKEQGDNITLVDDLISQGRIDEITLAIIRVQQLYLNSIGYPIGGVDTDELIIPISEEPLILFQD